MSTNHFGGGSLSKVHGSLHGMTLGCKTTRKRFDISRTCEQPAMVKTGGPKRNIDQPPCQKWGPISFLVVFHPVVIPCKAPFDQLHPLSEIDISAMMCHQPHLRLINPPVCHLDESPRTCLRLRFEERGSWSKALEAKRDRRERSSDVLTWGEPAIFFFWYLFLDGVLNETSKGNRP